MGGGRACHPHERLFPGTIHPTSLESPNNQGVACQLRQKDEIADRTAPGASMLPTAKPSPLPGPTALRPAGEIKVRKRRENRSSASSFTGAQSSTCSEIEPTVLGFAQKRSPPSTVTVQGSPPSIVEPESPTLHCRKSPKNRVFSRVLGSIQASRSNPSLQPTRNGQSDGSIFRKLSMRRRPSFPSRSKSSEFPAQPPAPS